MEETTEISTYLQWETLYRADLGPLQECDSCVVWSLSKGFQWWEQELSLHGALLALYNLLLMLDIILVCHTLYKPMGVLPVS